MLFLFPKVRKVLFRTLNPLVIYIALLTDGPCRVSSFYQWQCFSLVDTEFKTLY